MKLNNNFYVSIVLLLGSASCWKDATELKAKLETHKEMSFSVIDGAHTDSAPSHRELTVRALEYPKSYINHGFDPSKINMDDKEEKKVEQSTVYRLEDLSKEELIKVKNVRTNANISTIEPSIKTKIDKKVQENAKMLREVLLRVPLIAELFDTSKETTDFDQILISHVEQFISDSLVFDASAQTFGALHKAVEGLLSVHEVERKAREALSAVINNLDKAEFVKVKPIEFRIKETPAPLKESENKAKEAPKINLLKVAIAAANKSTSSPLYLGYTLIIALVVSIGLLVFKALATEEIKDDDEEETN